MKQGWADDSIYSRNKRTTVGEITPEQKARSDAYLAEACEALSQGRAEEFFAAIRDRDAADIDGDDALDREKDREARIAVEGDTALDHLPFGEGGE